jgi:hypothetical protein
VTNVATIQGDSCNDGCTTTATATATINFVGTPGWTLTKAPNPTTYSLPGQVITYTYVLKNTGPIAITAISLTDNKVATVNCPANTLAPGAQMSCTGLYTITAADVTATTVTNTATATGTPAAGTLAPVTAQATITLDKLQHQQQTLALINQFLTYRLQLCSPRTTRIASSTCGAYPARCGATTRRSAARATTRRSASPAPATTTRRADRSRPA